MKQQPTRSAWTLALLTVALVSVPTHSPRAAKSTEKTPEIREVYVDPDARTVLILGSGFGDYDALTVSLGEAGDITTACTLESPNVITCDLAETGHFPEGDYRLTVSTGKGEKRSDSYDLTVGAVGPEGSAGPRGPAGAPGPTGPAGEVSLTQLCALEARINAVLPELEISPACDRGGDDGGGDGGGLPTGDIAVSEASVDVDEANLTVTGVLRGTAMPGAVLRLHLFSRCARPLAELFEAFGLDPILATDLVADETGAFESTHELVLTQEAFDDLVREALPIVRVAAFSMGQLDGGALVACSPDFAVTVTP